MLILEIPRESSQVLQDFPEGTVYLVRPYIEVGERPLRRTVGIRDGQQISPPTETATRSWVMEPLLFMWLYLRYKGFSSHLKGKPARNEGLQIFLQHPWGSSTSFPANTNVVWFGHELCQWVYSKLRGSSGEVSCTSMIDTALLWSLRPTTDTLILNNRQWFA